MASFTNEAGESGQDFNVRGGSLGRWINQTLRLPARLRHRRALFGRLDTALQDTGPWQPADTYRLRASCGTVRWPRAL